MEVGNFIREYPKELDEDTCEETIKTYRLLRSMPGLREDPKQTNNKEGRKDDGLFFDETVLSTFRLMGVEKLIRKVNSRLQRMFNDYTREFSAANVLSMPLCSTIVKLHHVRPHEGYFVFHSEVGGHSTNMSRCLVWIIYLNTVKEEDGGATEFLFQGIKVQPEVGKGIIWPAQWTHTHRGNPIYGGEKYYLTGWFDYVK